MNKEKIIQELSLKFNGSKGWMNGDLVCPECGRSDKISVLFVENGGICSCFRCKSFPLFKVLKSMGREDLIDYDYEFTPKTELGQLRLFSDEEIKEERSIPVGFSRINKDDYLDLRGFVDWQYDLYNVGVNNLDVSLKGKLVFLIYQKGLLKAWVARSRKSKEYHKKNLKDFRDGRGSLDLRYKNSEDDFSKILGGLDEIKPETSSIIIVEGLFDKANLDRYLKVNKQDIVKVCYTFGSSISVEQIRLIPETVRNVFIMYDPDALKKVKDFGGLLLSSFNTYVIPMYGDKDPGELNVSEFSEAWSKSSNFIHFYTTLVI